MINFLRNQRSFWILIIPCLTLIKKKFSYLINSCLPPPKKKGKKLILRNFLLKTTFNAWLTGWWIYWLYMINDHIFYNKFWNHSMNPEKLFSLVLELRLNELNQSKKIFLKCFKIIKIIPNMREFQEIKIWGVKIDISFIMDVYSPDRFISLAEILRIYYDCINFKIQCILKIKRKIKPLATK